MNWEQFAFWPICIASTLYVFVLLSKRVCFVIRSLRKQDGDPSGSACDRCDGDCGKK